MTDEPDVSPSVERTAHELEAAGSMTYSQALVWTLRVVEDVPRQEAADRLGISTSTLDGTLSRARAKIQGARDLLDLVDELDQ